MPDPVGHVPVPYPSAADGIDSLQHLIGAVVRPGTVPAADMAAHAWVVTGAGLAVALPPTDPRLVGAAGGVILSPSQVDALRQFEAMRAGGPEAQRIDPERWRNILKVVVPILLALLGI